MIRDNRVVRYGRTTILIMMMFLLGGIFVSYSKADAEENISLNYTEKTIVYGSTDYLDDLTVSDAYGQEIESSDVQWESDDEDIATVKYGVVMIKDTGKVTITATYNDMTAKCTITVKKPKVTLKKGKLSGLAVGDKVKKWYTTNVGSKVTITSGNKKVIKITSDHKLKAVSLGKSVIKVKIKHGNTVKYTVRVTSKNIFINDTDTVKLEKHIKTISGYKKSAITLKDSSQATVSDDMLFAPLKTGKCVVDVKSDGKTYKINIRVTNYTAMENVAMDTLKDTLRYPASLSINDISHDGRSITIDYSSMNKYGGYNRDKFIFTIDMNGKYTYKTVSIYD